MSLDLGPSGFEAYARLRFVPDPSAPDQQPGDIKWPDEYPGRLPLVLDAVAALAPHTTTPDDAYYVVWNSGVSMTFPRIEHRVGIKDLHLDDCDAPSFIWPRDRAWRIAWVVDPHFAGVGGTAAASALLLAVPRLHAVPHDAAARAPYYY